MIIFDHFLRCIALKSFGRFIGYVGAVSAVLAIYAVFLVVTAKAADLLTLNERYFGGKRNNGDVVFNVAVFVAFLILAGIFHISLIFGIRNNKSMLVLPYVLFTIFPIVALTYSLSTSVHFSGSSKGDVSSIVSIMAYVVSILFSIYYALCVYSLYSLIREDEKKRRVYKTCDTIIVAK